MKICGICGYPYSSPITHIKNKHRTQMWERWDQEHPMPHGICAVCKKLIKVSHRKHALDKHLGKAANEFYQAEGLS